MSKPPFSSRGLRLGFHLALLAALCLGMVACAELDWTGNDDDAIGPGGRHLAHLPAAYHLRQPAASQPGDAENVPATQPEGAATQPSPYAATQPAPESGPLDLTVQSSILTTLQHNLALKVDSFNPAIQRTAEQQQRAVFDPDLTGNVTATHTHIGHNHDPEVALEDDNNLAATAGVTELLPTGTTVLVQAGTTFDRDSPAYTDSSSTTPVSLTVTQSLLRGGSLAANLASLRQARIDVLSSQYELRGFAESLLEQVENTYWAYTLAERQIDIFTDSLDVAEKQLAETNEMIRVGKLAEIERAAAESEVALRREDLIDARSKLATTRITLLTLLNPGGGPGMWNRAITLRNRPFVPQGRMDPVDAHVQVALRMRPDLNQARLQVQRDTLQIVKTRNGLLPKLDLFVALGKTGYANSFGPSVPNIFTGHNYDAIGGFNFEFPIGDRAAGALDLAAHLTRDQAREAVKNMELTVQVDVRSQYIEVERSREQISATEAARRFQEEELRGEKEKFRVGKSTSLLVAQSERDLLASQIAEIQAVVGHLQATVTLFRLEGTLLERRGIQAPGVEPVDPNGRAPGVEAP